MGYRCGVISLAPLSDQVVVVMGASSGIGRAAAVMLARRGARVVVCARDAASLESLVREIEDAGGRATAVPADVTDIGAVEAVGRTAVETYGGIDTWVHAAAVLLVSRVEDTTEEEFRRVIDVNLMGHVHGLMAALPHLRARGRGSFVAISSVEARRAFPYHGAYAAAKHGVEALLEALRVELRQEGVPIAITNVIPASINTPLFEKARTKIGVLSKPMPPIYDPEVVAEAIVHAAEHPARDLIAGGAGKALLMGQRLSPSLLDAVLLRIGFRTQRTATRLPAGAPDNLFAPLPHLGRVEGPFVDGSRSRSLYTLLRTRVPHRRALAMASGGPRWRDTGEPAGSPAPHVSR